MDEERETRIDAELLAARDDPAAFARFYRRHVRAVIAFFHRQLVALHRRGRVERRARRRLGMTRIELTDAMLERVEAIADAERVEVAVAMAALPAAQRDAVRARVLDERSYEEIAAEQAISPPAARQRVSRGLAALRAHLRSAR